MKISYKKMKNYKGINNLFYDKCKKYSDKMAVSFPIEKKDYTYSDLYIKVSDMAKIMKNMGICKGSHIGVIGENQSKYLFIILAGYMLGGVLVACDNRWTNREVCEYIKKADIEYLFWLKNDSFDEIEGPKRIVTNEDIFFEYNAIDNSIDIFEEVDSEQLYSIQFTSGTGGKPKAAMITRNAAFTAAINYGRMVGFDENEKILLTLPFSYCYCNILNVLAFWNYGCHVVVSNKYKATTSLVLLEKYECSCMCGVPTMFLLMIEQNNFNDFNLNKLEKILIGGDCCVQSVAEQISTKFKVEKITIGYGLTEAASLCTVSDFTTDKNKRINSIGKLLPNLEAKIIGLDGQKVVEDEKIGELYIRGWSTMKGYYNDEIETRKVLSEDGWLRTGDLVYKDLEDFYHYSGRSKEMIIRGGCNVSPVEIENVISEVEGVKKVSVVGIEDKIMGEEIIAFITTNEEDKVMIRRIQQNLLGRLSSNKIPKHIFVVDSLALSSTGKVLKKDLKKRAIEMINRGCR